MNIASMPWFFFPFALLFKRFTRLLALIFLYFCWVPLLVHAADPIPLARIPIWLSSTTDFTNSVAWGDVDGDGDLDLAVGNNSTTKVYLNQSGILQTSAIWISTDGGSVEVAWGDVDGDGDLDLATGNYNSETKLYLNQGGNLQSPAAWSSEMADSTSSVAWGDVDGDGDLDLAVGNLGEDKLYLNHEGVLQKPAVWSSGVADSTQSIAWGDVDGDGDLDLAVGNSAEESKVYLNHGGVLQKPAAWSSGVADSTQSIAWGDVDGDGDLDLAVGNSGFPVRQENKVYFNQGGILQKPALWASGDAGSTQSVAWGDVDGDGDLDLAAGNFGDGNKVYLNQGGILQKPAAWSDGNADWTNSVAWGDMDMDGDLDLAVGSYHYENKVYANQSMLLEVPAFWTSGDINWVRSIAWGDVDGDGDLDLAVGSLGSSISSPPWYSGGEEKLYLNQGGVLQKPAAWSSAALDLTWSIAWGDVDGDGDLDLAVGNIGEDKVYLNYEGVLQKPATWSSGTADSTYSVAWGDVDGDGDLDLAVGNRGEESKVYLNQSGVLQTPAAWSSGIKDSTWSVAWGDVDADGDLDLTLGNWGEENKIYFNQGGVLQKPAGWSDSVADRTEGTAWGDVDGDGDLDLAVGNYDSQSKVYLNQGSVLQKPAAWPSGNVHYVSSVAWGDADGDGDLDLAMSSMRSLENIVYLNQRGSLQTFAEGPWSSHDTDLTTSIAWGDIDGDGDLDLAAGNYDTESKVYLNQGPNTVSLQNDPTYIALSTPGHTAAAALFSTPSIVLSTTIPITYVLFDTEHNAASKIFPEFSPNGGGQWLPATSVTGTITTNLAASPYPTGTTHTFLWNAGVDLIKSDNVVFRIRAQPAYTHSPILWPAQSASTFPFRVEAAPWFAKVIDESGQAVGGASVFYAGQLLTTTELSHTTSAGLLRLDSPQEGVPLVALALTQEYGTLRAAHDGWAYRTYLTSLNLDKEGNPRPATIGAPGQQLVTVRVHNPLILFNIVVSVEWDADQTYLSMLEDAFRKASDYLYDVSDGQMAFGQVAIYDNAQFWSHADFQISAKNMVHPYAYVSGITAVDTAHAVRVGRFWSGNSGNEGNWHEPNGYRTLIHEFGHYALHLHDEYFVRTVDEQGRFTGQRVAACTDLGVYADEEKPTGASIMYYQYKTSELADNDRWGSNCQNTEQHRNNGKADWQTVLEYYGGPKWVLNTPTARTSVMAGPEQFPRHLLSLPQIIAHDSGAPDGAARTLMVINPQQQAEPGVLVALFTMRDQQTIALDQGLTDTSGHITVYGAVKGDRVQAATFDGALAGSIPIGDESTLRLQLAPVGALRSSAQTASVTPYLSLMPTSDGRGLLIQVHDLASSSLPLNALLAPAEGGGAPQATVLAYNPTEAAYAGTVSLNGVGLGTGRVQISGGSLAVPLHSTYNLQRISFDQAHSLYAEDGNFALHLPAQSLSGGADGYATVLPTGYAPGPLPVGQQIIGSAYTVRLSSANLLTKAAIVELYYHPEVMGNKLAKTIYLWEPVKKAWTPLQSETDPNNQTVSAITTHLGIYALMGEAVVTDSTKLYLPLIKQ